MGSARTATHGHIRSSIPEIVDEQIERRDPDPVYEEMRRPIEDQLRHITQSTEEELWFPS